MNKLSMIHFLGTAIVATCQIGASLPSFANTPDCRTDRFEIDLPKMANASIFAQICRPDQMPEGTSVQILLHGGAYDHRYWDWPNRPETYSYVLAATQRKFVTVNIDRLGYGRSSRPDGRQLSFELGAEAVSQLVDLIKDGGLGFVPGSVVLNGHSMGGIVAEIVAGQNPDVDGLIVSGLANSGGAPEDGDDEGGGPPIQSLFVSATEDAKFADAGWADGYITTAPHVRGRLFHAPDAIDPANMRLEEALKDTLGVAEIAAVQSGGADRPEFAGPSLYVLGQFDVIACEGQDCAVRFHGSDALQIVAGAGHSLNVSTSAQAFYELTFEWLHANGLGSTD